MSGNDRINGFSKTAAGEGGATEICCLQTFPKIAAAMILLQSPVIRVASGGGKSIGDSSSWTGIYKMVADGVNYIRVRRETSIGGRIPNLNSIITLGISGDIPGDCPLTAGASSLKITVGNARIISICGPSGTANRQV